MKLLITVMILFSGAAFAKITSEKIEYQKPDVIYRGAIDSSLNYYTKKSNPENYVEKAIASFFKHEKISPEETESFGCAITFQN